MAAPTGRRLGAALAMLLVLGALAAGLSLAGGSPSPPDTRAAAFVPADALAYVNLSLAGDREPVRRALAIARRLPGFAALLAQARGRLAAFAGGSPGAGLSRAQASWLGDEAALALLNTSGSTAGSLLLAQDRSPRGARAFLAAAGGRPAGSYRGVALQSLPNGAAAALIGPFLALGQPASVRAAIDVRRGAPSLGANGAYRRASAGEPAARVLDAYLPAAGVRRLLLAQGGALGAVGVLLDQPRLQGVALWLAPAADGFQIGVHSALAPLGGAHGPGAFHPTLASALPASTILMLDTTHLAQVAPRALAAGATGGVGATIGPLLARLGAALRAEGVDVGRLLSLLSGESAVAIVDSGGRPALLVLARTRDPARARMLLASLVIPLQRLFPATANLQSGSFSQSTIAGVSVQRLALAPGVQLDYAVTARLVALSTSGPALSAVIRQSATLDQQAGYRRAIAAAPARVGSLLYLDLSQLLGLGERTGLAQSKGFSNLRADLRHIHAIVLTSTDAGDTSTAELFLQIK